MKHNNVYLLKIIALAQIIFWQAIIHPSKDFCMNMNITKAVIPAAGMGTRFLPYTKTVPKELLPILNFPAIHYIVEEGFQSGIHDFYIIANEHKKMIFNYFGPNEILNHFLTKNGKSALLKKIHELTEQTHIFYVEQEKPLGLGHAILMAEKQIDNQYFGILLPDDLFLGTEPALEQLIKIAQEQNASVIAVQEVSEDKVSSYGVISIKHKITDNLFEIDDLIEKPNKEDAPSNLAISGRYVLSPAIFKSLSLIKPGAGGEIQLTDGLKHMLKQGHKIFAYKIKNSTRFDLGTPQGWLEANCAIAQQDSLYKL